MMDSGMDAEALAQPVANSGMQLADRMLSELIGQTAPVSAAWLCKRLQVRQSSLLRVLASLGSCEIAGQTGPGWVQSEQVGERLLISLTAAGRAACRGSAWKK